MGEEAQEQEDWKKYISDTDVLEMKLEDILVSRTLISNDSSLVRYFSVWQGLK